MPTAYSSTKPVKSSAKIERICIICKKHFSVYPSVVKRGEGTLCSKACWRIWWCRPVSERFWEKVNKSGECWNWTAFKDNWGYGILRVNNRNVHSNRMAWMLMRGPIPEGLHVLHTCDNPACVNPGHLYPGTDKDNMADAVSRNRLRPKRGGLHGMAKLTDNDVLEIKKGLRCGVSQPELAKRFGVTNGNISSINVGQTWRHIPWPSQ